MPRRTFRWCFVASVGMVAIRAAVGFFLFTLAFTLRRDSQPAFIYGLAAACYGIGAFTGHTVIGLLRRRFSEQQLIGLAIAAPAAFTAVGILGVSTPLLLVIAALVGLSTTLGRNAFDSLLQRRAPGGVARTCGCAIRDAVPACLGLRRGSRYTDLTCARGQHDDLDRDLFARSRGVRSGDARGASVRRRLSRCAGRRSTAGTDGAPGVGGRGVPHRHH